MTTRDQLNYDPKATPLTDDEMKSAVPELTNTFRKVTRQKVDPAITGQNLLNISFMLLEKPQNGVVGFFKGRGAFNDEDASTKGAEDIIKYTDSCFMIHTANMGHWHPITNNKEYSKDLMDVKSQQDEVALRDRAIKEEAKKNQQLRKELEEQKEEIKRRNEDKEDENEDSLDYYTKKMVTSREIQAYIKQGEEKLDRLRKSVKDIQNEVLLLDQKHPEFCKQWLANYNNARVKAGLPELTEEDLAKPNILGMMDE